MGGAVAKQSENSGAETGKFAAELATEYVPRFGSEGWRSAFSSDVAIMISMMSTAFMAHYSAPKFIWELQNNTMARFNRVVALSFADELKRFYDKENIAAVAQLHHV